MKKLLVPVVIALLLAAAFAAPLWAQSGAVGWYEFENNVLMKGDLVIEDDLTITDDTTLTDDVAVGGDLSVTGDTTLAGPLNTSKQAATLTNDFALVPTTSYIEVTAAGAVGGVLSTTGVIEGMFINIVNVGAQTITFTDTGTSKLSGNAALGANDTLTVIFDGTNFNELAQADN